MSSSLLIVCNKIARRLGIQTFASGNFTTPSAILQQIIDEINETIQSDNKIHDWNFLFLSGTKASTSGSRTLTLDDSSLSSLDILRPLRRVHESTTPYNLREVGELEWQRYTNILITGTPRRYRRAGTSSGSLVLELDPRPTSAITYTIEGTRVLSMSASTDTVAYPDDVLVNGALTRHLDYDGNDYGLASSNHDRAIEQMLHAEQDGEDIIF